MRRRIVIAVGHLQWQDIIFLVGVQVLYFPIPAACSSKLQLWHAAYLICFLLLRAWSCTQTCCCTLDRDKQQQRPNDCGTRCHCPDSQVSPIGPLFESLTIGHLLGGGTLTPGERHSGVTRDDDTVTICTPYNAATHDCIFETWGITLRTHALN